MSIYEIPLAVRCIDLSTGLAYQKSKFTVLNGKGVFVSYDINDDVDLEEIKEIEPSIRKTFILVPAPDFNIGSPSAILCVYLLNSLAF